MGGGVGTHKDVTFSRPLRQPEVYFGLQDLVVPLRIPSVECSIVFVIHMFCQNFFSNLGIAKYLITAIFETFFIEKSEELCLHVSD